MSSAVQFYGIDQVLTAAENRACPAWGIFQMRQFLFKYEGVNLTESLQLLQKTLECIDHSAALYTIKFYEQEGAKLIKVKENTPCDGSFNFKMMPEEMRQQRELIYQANSPRILEKLEGIEARLNAMETASDDDDDDDDSNSINGAIIGLLKEPAKLNQLIGVVKNVLGMAPAPGFVGQVYRTGQNGDRPEDPPPGTGANMSQPTSEQDLQRLGNAIDTLQKNDPAIVEHLEKLARLSESKPQQFKNLLSMLEMMP